MAFVRVKKGELKVGDALPWSVFRESGTLLLHKGEEVESQHQVDMLVTQGFRPDDTSDRLNLLLEKKIDNPFAFVDEIHQHLKHLLKNLTLPTNDGALRLNYMAQLLIRLCNEFPDAMVGVVHRFDEKPYSVTHSIHTAIISSVLAQHHGHDDGEQLRVVCAALTANLGMLDLHDTLENQAGPLSEEQQEKLRRHPVESEQLLEKNVTTDELWLQMVRQHHERLDGSGYPDGLQGDAITHGARIIALADRYSAMVQAHAHKPAEIPGQVLKQLYAEKGNLMDESLCQRLIHVLGVYPPGSFVRLKNGETALVIKHSTEPGQHWPLVSSFKGRDRNIYINPLNHDSNLPDYAIECMVGQEKLPFSNEVMWGYTKL
ncbi:MAG: HD domain-containing protein [Gammaproteobacteria bacterium]|nr:HD domain-containing protein [Gammaproteobacteria bacterium]